MKLYSDILDLAIVVDAFHFKNNSEDDTFCQKETNPTLDSIPVGLDSERMVELQSLLEFENSESSESFFRYAGTLLAIVDNEALSNATFFVHRMFYEHNERQIFEVRARRQTCMDRGGDSGRVVAKVGGVLIGRAQGAGTGHCE